MRNPNHLSMTTKFKAVFAKLKVRRRSERTKATVMEAAMTACVDDMSDTASQMEDIAAAVDHMDISTSSHLPIAPSGTFDFRPPPSSPTWPGPRYDDLVQVVPGIFNRSRDMMLPPKSKAKSKRSSALMKRSSSQDDKASMSAQRRLDTTVRNSSISQSRAVIIASKKTQQTASIANSKRPLFCPPLAPRAEPLHLLSLPGEIRNQIYRYLYLSKEPLKAQFRSIMRPHQGLFTKPEIKRFPREPTLALVCRQLRQEAGSLFYAENTFTFTQSAPMYMPPANNYPMTSTKMLARWMAASRLTDSLTRVELSLGGSWTGKADSYSRQQVKYVFRRLPNGTTAVTQDLGAAARCVCFDRRVLEDALPEMVGVKAAAAENLIHALILVVARRLAGIEMGGYEAASWLCSGCGKLGWKGEGMIAGDG